MNKAIKDSCEKTQDVEKGRIEVRPVVSFVSDATYHDSAKDKAKFIGVMCRYNSANKDVKANNYQVHVKKFDHGTAEDVLLWYNKVRKVIKQKPCETVQNKRQNNCVLESMRYELSNFVANFFDCKYCL